MMYMLPQALVSSMAYEFIEFQNRFIYFLLAMLYWALTPKSSHRRWCLVCRVTCQSLRANERSEKQQSISSWMEIHLQISTFLQLRRGMLNACLWAEYACKWDSCLMPPRDSDLQLSPTCEKRIQVVEYYAKWKPDSE